LFAGGHFSSTPTSSKLYTATGSGSSVQQSGSSVSSTSNSTPVGGLFTFKDQDVVSRVGISWISTEQACDNVANEIPKGTTFEAVVSDAVAEWNLKVLSKVTTTNTNQTALNLLYSSLYFMHLIPTNQTGENPGWTSSEPYYSDIFTFWVRLCDCMPGTKSTDMKLAGSVSVWHSINASPAAAGV
jgi:putative alpha-1,2-mannosidase